MKITSKDKCKQMSNKVSNGLLGGGFSKLLNKDITELNKVVLTFCCILFLVCVGIVSYKTNNSYALFSDSITGTKTIEAEVSLPKIASEELISKVGTSGLETVTHEADSTLQIGATEELTEYRFRGGKDVVTNNYVYFNCSDINNQTSSTCELYRIIGVFPTDDGTGNIENRVKLIKEESYVRTFWNIAGTTDWTTASLNTNFNTTYYNTITEAYQGLIGNTKYYLGANGWGSSVKSDIMYQSERKISGGDGFYNNNFNSWTGKIALMYASDYGYGANNTCSENKTLYEYDFDNCKNNNWLYSYQGWLLTIQSSTIAFDANASGVGYMGVVDEATNETHPVFYLTSDAKFNGTGDGSSTNPYQLKG